MQLCEDILVYKMMKSKQGILLLVKLFNFSIIVLALSHTIV